MEGSRWELVCQKVTSANSSVVQREMSQPKPAHPPLPAGCCEDKSLAGVRFDGWSLLGSGTAKLLGEAPLPGDILVTGSCSVAEMLLMSPRCRLQDVPLRELAVQKASCHNLIRTHCDTSCSFSPRSFL